LINVYTFGKIWSSYPQFADYRKKRNSHNQVRSDRQLKAMEQPIWNFEQEPTDEPMDETGVNLRAYFDRMDDEKMQQYSPDWPDEKVMEWDDNFRDDGEFMMFCSEREVEVGEYRQVLEECIRYRNRVRDTLLAA